ncbi:hypothetical protein LOTGIDRAFT_176935, partial [Lottia gigantea]
ALLIPRSPGASNFDGKIGATKPIRDKRYQHLNSAVQAQEQRTTRGREDSINSRYSVDPVKFLRDKGDFDQVAEDIELGVMNYYFYYYYYSSRRYRTWCHELLLLLLLLLQ